MASKNFVVQNGLQVGPLTISAATGQITSTSTAAPVFNGNVVANSSTESTSITSGALVVKGGAGVSGRLNVGGNIVAGSGTASTNATTGALVVNGGVGVSGDVWITGNINAATLNTTQANVFTTDQPLAYFDSSYTYPYDYDIGFFSHFRGASANVYQHTGAVRDYSDNTWKFFSNVATEPNKNVNWSFAGLIWDPVKAGELTLANTTTSSSTTTGALKVGGGAGIAGAINVGGSSAFTDTTASTSTSTGALKVSGGIGVAKNLYVGGDGTNAVVHTGHIIPSANATYNLGSSSAWYGTLYGVSTQAKYADLAENYEADAAYPYGTVLMFGGVKELTVATADTKAVAGVVSQNPAHLMNGQLNGANVVPLALTGRVPCNVVGPIKKGDLLVSAGFGYAKANNNAQAGQIIGKALADFTGAKGQIEVVVGRF